MGKFASKCCESDCCLVNTEPYSPWTMDEEGCIKQLKQGLSWKVIKSAIPKRLWDHCIELKALIHSKTALYIYGLEVQVPETLITGQTDDISHLCKYEWF